MKTNQKNNQARPGQGSDVYMQGMTPSKLPLISTGYMDLMMQGVDLGTNSAMRRTELSRGLDDLGVSFEKNGGIAEGKNGGAFSAYQVANRGAQASSVDRGFGTSGAVRRSAFAPAREDILKQAVRARSMTNQQDRLERTGWLKKRQLLMGQIPSYVVQANTPNSSPGGGS